MSKKGKAHRKWSKEEKLRIVHLHLDEHKSLRQLEKEYGINNGLIGTWVKKYLVDGTAGLIDRRGHHKTDGEVDKLEHLRRENLRLKRQLKENDMVVELLKKVTEFERM